MEGTTSFQSISRKTLFNFYVNREGKMLIIVLRRIVDSRETRMAEQCAPKSNGDDIEPVGASQSQNESEESNEPREPRT